MSSVYFSNVSTTSSNKDIIGRCCGQQHKPEAKLYAVVYYKVVHNALYLYVSVSSQ